MKKFLLILLTVFFISSSAAYNLGTFTYEQSKTVDTRNVSFQLGVVNLGDSDIELDLSVEGLENGNLVFPKDSAVLKPTEVSGNPEGEGWISVSSGKYARVNKMPFWVIMDQKVDEEFNIRVRAEKSNSGDASGIKPRAVQIRDYNYRIEYPEEEKSTVPRGYERDNGEQRDLEITRSPEEDVRENTSYSEETSTEQDNVTNSSKATKTSDNSTSKQGDGASGTTLLLSIGAVSSLVYLWMVV